MRPLYLWRSQLLAQTVEQATGVGIDHYAEIGMGGLANVVDAVGGVNICVDEPIMDPLAGIDLAAGCQDLEGSDALGYVTPRHRHGRFGPSGTPTRILRSAAG